MTNTHQVLIALAAGLALCGCGGQRQATTDTKLVNTSLDVLSRDNLPSLQPTPSYNQAELDLLAQEALNLQAALANMPEPDPEEAPAPATPDVAPSPTPEPRASAEATPEIVLPEAPPPPSSKPLPVRIEATAVALVDLLRQQAATDSSAKAYLALAALEVLNPGALQNIITDSTTEGATIAPEDQRAIEGLRSFLAAINDSESRQPLPERFAAHVHLLTASAPLQIRTVQLCSEVMSFGQYVALPSGAFLQGRNTRAIVYTEVEHFAHRDVNDSDRTAAAVAGRPTTDTWAVDLSQELRLYHVADGLLAWSRPEQAIVETSRNKRRDFYLVQPITFPSTVTVGSYTLKVIVRDRTTGNLAESNIPLDVVADPALVRATSR